MDEAPETRNETTQPVVRDPREVQRDMVEKAQTVLVVATLIVSLTYTHCLSSVEAAQYRKDIIELQEFGGPPGIREVRWFDFALLSRWAFFQALLATFLAAFAALPFKFANFFDDEGVDDKKMKELLSTTKVLIVTASYFLLFSLEALFFSFVCSQLVAPYIDYQCALACEVALLVFCLCCVLLFVVFNGVSYWRHRRRLNRK